MNKKYIILASAALLALLANGAVWGYYNHLNKVEKDTAAETAQEETAAAAAEQAAVAETVTVMQTTEPEAPEEPAETEDAKEEDSLPRFPDGISLFGADLSGMTVSEAEEAAEAAFSSYRLTVNCNGTRKSFSSSELGMSHDTVDYSKLLEDVLAGKTVSCGISVSTSSAKGRLESRFSTEPADAYLSYSGGKYILHEDEDGSEIDADDIVSDVTAAARRMEASVSVTCSTKSVPADVTADSEKAKSALETANSYLAMSLSYDFALPGGSQQLETVDIHSLLKLGSDKLTVSVNTSAVNSFVSRMNSKYSSSGGSTNFVTTGGRTLSVKVPSGGQKLKTTELYNDIIDCLKNRTSGIRSVSYTESGSTLACGGTYVEVDISSQHLWFYKDGQLLVSTGVVTGCVANGTTTPGGVYTIKYKKTDAYLMGNSHVDFWMPFNGGIGLHDADRWRSSYGGSIYLYSGSHGCVNMPRWAAAIIYDNITAGDYVILYGGTYSLSPAPNELTGTEAYTVTSDSDTFKLDMTAVYAPEDTVLSYSSSDESVASVSSNGTVTVHGEGTAVITVTAEKCGIYTSVSKTVTVTVTGGSSCDVSGHSWNAGTLLTEPSCTESGSMEYVCTVCGEKKTEMVPAKGHVFSEWTLTKEPSCMENGSRTRVCTVCGCEDTESIEKTGHTMSGGVCTVCGFTEETPDDGAQR